MVYLAIKHFRHLVEGRSFFVVTDHKPLTLLSLRGPSSILLARSATSISYRNSPPTFVISQDPQMQQQMHDHVLKVANLPTSTTAIDFAAMARVQQEDLAKSTAPPSLTLRATPPPRTLLCDISHGAPRPYVTQAFRRTVFDALYSLSHPRTGINADARKWTRFNAKELRSTSTPSHLLAHLQHQMPGLTTYTLTSLDHCLLVRDTLTSSRVWITLLSGRRPFLYRISQRPQLHRLLSMVGSAALVSHLRTILTGRGAPFLSLTCCVN